MPGAESRRQFFLARVFTPYRRNLCTPGKLPAECRDVLCNAAPGVDAADSIMSCGITWCGPLTFAVDGRRTQKQQEFKATNRGPSSGRNPPSGRAALRRRNIKVQRYDERSSGARCQAADIETLCSVRYVGCDGTAKRPQGSNEIDL